MSLPKGKPAMPRGSRKQNQPRISSHPQNQMRRFEQTAASQGFQNIAGVDEVGRGCLAGPVVACCVILPWEEDFPGVRDSKLLNAKQREEACKLIFKKALEVGIGSVESAEIDRMNILRATFKAMRLAIEGLKTRPGLLLVDGNQAIRNLTIPQKPIPKGDRLSLSIAAASIVAKWTRDQWMRRLAEQFPQFRFDLHKGYGTSLHLDELKTHGPTHLHRFSFTPVKNSFTLFPFS